jgi:hypothetical protein
MTVKMVMVLTEHVLINPPATGAEAQELSPAQT